ASLGPCGDGPPGGGGNDPGAPGQRDSLRGEPGVPRPAGPLPVTSRHRPPVGAAGSPCVGCPDSLNFRLGRPRRVDGTIRTGLQRMSYDPTNLLIVQGDRTVLVEVDNPRYAEARDALAPFAELEKSPEHIHTYRLTPLSLWNAAAAGHTAEAMIDVLARYSKFPLPANLAPDLKEQ